MARITIVDDNPNTLRLLGLAVERVGHRAVCVLGGEPALPLMRQMRPDLVVLDVEMPYVSGIEVLASVRREEGLRELPVLMFSGCSDPAVRAEATRLGASDYILKGVAPEALLACIEQHLAKRQTQPGSAGPGEQAA